MKIGFDAKRAFLNNSGLGNYARTIIKTLNYFNPKLKQYLYTTSVNDDDFFREITQFTTIEIIKPNSFLENKLKNYWRSYSITKNLIKNKFAFTVAKCLKTKLLIHQCGSEK